MVQFPPCSSLSLLNCFLSSHLIANHKSTFFETKPLANRPLSFHIVTSWSYLSGFTLFITWLTVFTECSITIQAENLCELLGFPVPLPPYLELSNLSFRCSVL